MLKRIKSLSIYRILTAAGFISAVALSLAIPAHMGEPDDWAYYYGVKNFSQGKLVVDDQLHFQQVNQANQQGGRLVQYVKVTNNEWALEKAPGYVFFMVPFELLGIPRGGNVLLALGMIIVTFIVLKRLRDEKTACIGPLLMLFTPVSLIMLNRSFMDTFAASSFLVMGGGLYIYYCLERAKLRPLLSGMILFLAFLLASWSVVTRYTNLPIAAILLLHLIISRFTSLRKGERINLRLEIPSTILGIGIPLTILLIYNNAVFGSPFDYGYNYSHAPIKFAFQYIGAVNPAGQSIPLQIIQGNLRNMPWALLLGFPLLFIGVPGIGIVLYYKVAALFRRGNLPEMRSNIGAELPWGILLILMGWFLSVFALYMTYEWTSAILMSKLPFIIVDRFYLPGLLPVAIICSLIIARFPTKLGVAILVLAVAACTFLYIQSALGEIPLPEPRPPIFAP